MLMNRWNQINAMAHCEKGHAMTDEELIQEVKYHMAMKLIGSLHDEGLIPDELLDEVKRMAMERFSPIISKIS